MNLNDMSAEVAYNVDKQTMDITGDIQMCNAEVKRLGAFEGVRG